MTGQERRMGAPARNIRRAWVVATVGFVLVVAAGTIGASGGTRLEDASLRGVSLGTTAQAQLWSERLRMCELRGSTVYVPPELLPSYVALGAVPGPCE